MTERKPANKGTGTSAKRTTTSSKFTAEERHCDLGRGRAMWPVAFALQEMTAAEEPRIGALVRKAVS